MKKLFLKNIRSGLYVETEEYGSLTFTKSINDALMFRADGDESESDAECTLALLNDLHIDCYVLEEVD